MFINFEKNIYFIKNNFALKLEYCENKLLETRILLGSILIIEYKLISIIFFEIE